MKVPKNKDYQGREPAYHEGSLHEERECEFGKIFWSLIAGDCSAPV